MGTSPNAVKIATLRAMPVNAATDSATRPLVESCRRAPTDVPALPRTPIRTARKATPRIARHAVNAAPPTPASAPNRASGPSMPNSEAADRAATVPTRRSRSRAMAAHGIGRPRPDPVDERPARPRAAIGAGEAAEHRAERDRPDERRPRHRDREADAEGRSREDADAPAHELGDVP